MSNVIYVKESSTALTPRNVKKPHLEDPSLNFTILDSIMQQLPSPSLPLSQEENEEEGAAVSEEQPQVFSRIRQLSKERKGIVAGAFEDEAAGVVPWTQFPKSLAQIPMRPMTLTSLKLKSVEEMKFKTVSRYIIDAENKVVMKTDAQLQAE